MLRTVLHRALHQRARISALQDCVQHAPAALFASFPGGWQHLGASEQCQTNTFSDREPQWLPSAMSGSESWSMQTQMHTAATTWQAAAQCSAHQNAGSMAASQSSGREGRSGSIPFPSSAYSTALAGRLGALADSQTEQREDDQEQLDLARTEEDDEDQLRRVELPLIHPKATVTSEHHPCGAEHLEFPFSAKAFYIGKGYKEQVKKLKEAAEQEGWQQEQWPGSQLICLRQSSQPFNDQEDYTGLSCETYIMPLDRLDSVVFFNGFGQEREIWERHTGGQLTGRFIEETRVTVIPDLDKHSKLFSDRVVLQQAELNYLRTIAFVLGQTVSLHYYEMQVDHMLRTFKDMNKEMRRTGTFKPVATKEELLQMVAQNNLLFTDIISKLGIMERFDVAWKHTNCSDIYEHLRADMEIENRNSNLQVKLHLVSENVKYLLELMQNQKSDFLEWIIIILIGAEIMVSLFDMFHKIQ